MAEKRESRHWPGPTLIVLGLLAVVGIAVTATVLYVIIWAYRAEVSPSVEYGEQIDALSAAAQPPGENGWPHLADAAGIMRELRAETGIDVEQFEAALSPVVEGTVREALATLKARGAFAGVAAAGRCPNVVSPCPPLADGPLVEGLRPGLGELRHLGRARIASMELAIADGDLDAAVEAFDQVLVMARACTHQAWVLDQLVGWAISGMVLERLRYAVQEYPLDAATLRRFQERLAARTPLGPPSLGLQGERLTFLDTVQWTHSDNGRGNGRLLPASAADAGFSDFKTNPKSNTGPPRIINVVGFYMASRKAVTREATALYDRAIAQSERPRNQRRRIDPDAVVRKLGPRYYMLSLFVIALDKFVQQGDAMRCRIDGTLLHLAVEGYRAEHGALPPTLDALVPEWIDAVPVDPYSGRPFVYRLVADDEHGRDYLLYSVGADGANNGGQDDPRQPGIAVWDRGSEIDFVFNQPRPAADE